MNAGKLVHMANQIGQFFAAMPDAAEARAGIALHLQRYWAPSMRQELLRALDAGEAAALAPLVREALLQARAAWAADGPA
ncbi:MAG: NAD-dependent formate dehydrogenase delta subunit [Pseudomonadota bacterium]|jgi:formate dehydrogenase subunit delta